MGAWLYGRRVALVAAAALAALGGTALAAGGGARIVISGGPSFKPNGYLKDSVHFGPGTLRVHTGETVTLVNTTDEPHTLSIVKGSQEPRTVAAVENCKVCEAIAQAHGVNPQAPPSGPPPKLLVDVGAPGFNAPGDSQFIAPKGAPGARVSFKITAKPGTTLNFICSIHAWMQGRFTVVR